jgi:hypothetical protein
VGWIALFLGCAVFYGLTANRGAQWQDSGFHVLRAITGDVLNPLGLALSHPLHHWLARLAVWSSIGEPSATITFISALAGALAVANVYGCVLTITDRKGCALFAALSLAVAHTFWQLSTITETYTLTAALLAAECWCLAGLIRFNQPGYLFGLGVFNGLGLANHMAAALTTPILTVVVLILIWRRRITVGQAAVAAVLWIVATLPYTGLVLHEFIRTGQFTETLQSALFGRSYGQNVLNVTLSARVLMIDIGFPLLNFPNLLIPAAILGVAKARSSNVPPLLSRALLLGLLINAAFVMRYSVVDQHMFFLPVYTLLAIFGGIGAASVSAIVSDIALRRLKTLAVLLLIATPISYLFLPTLARKIGLLERVRHTKPYRDDYVYLLAPWSHTETSAEQMSNEAVQLAGNTGLIFFEDGMAEFALEYKARRNGKNPDHIRPARNLEDIPAPDLNDQPIVLVPYNADQPRTQPPAGQWARRGDLYILEAATTSTQPK